MALVGGPISLQSEADDMKIRSYVATLLALVGILPLLAYGYLSIEESQKTTISEARRANLLLSRSAAQRVSEFLRHESRQLVTAGTGMLLAPRQEASHMGEAFLITFPHWHNLTVLDRQGTPRVTVPSVGYHKPTASGPTALSGAEDYSTVREAAVDRDGPFAHSMSVALPLYVVGSLRGAILADIDLISLWEPINSIRVGERGFVRLVTSDGTVLAHGHSADRQDVFAAQKQITLLDKARRGETIVNGLGESVMTSLSPVEGTDWSVIIELPVEEAMAAANRMQRTLQIFIAITILLSVAVGLLATRGLIRSLEVMAAHTKILAAGDLSPRLEPSFFVSEANNLAASINTMASSLDTLHSEARARERITTFGRVAAGLAHDLRLPIETMREAAKTIIENPEDSSAMDFFRISAQRELPRLARYLDDLNKLAQEGSVGLRLTSADLVELAKGVSAQFSAMPKWRGVQFLVAGEPVRATVDKDLLYRAVSNLVANGADATVNVDKGTVTITLAREDSDGDFYLIVVADNGHGMSANALSAVLAGDFCSTNRASGIGLGFGVARHIVESHGGTITGSSKPGSGTVFRVRLPVRISD